MYFAKHLGFYFLICFAKYFGHRSKNAPPEPFFHCVRIPFICRTKKERENDVLSFFFGAGRGIRSRATYALGLPRLLTVHRTVNSLPLPLRILSNAKNKTDTQKSVCFVFWRRQRDSNPRGISPKRFSRPPRYDHFDMPAYLFVISISLHRNGFQDSCPSENNVRIVRSLSLSPLLAVFVNHSKKQYSIVFSSLTRYDTLI